MLAVEENEMLVRVGPGTPMGELMRRYWIPFMQSDDLPELDGEPVRLTLLGEQLIAFRATSGQVGLVARRCPHRRADLFFGRNEEEGLRCTYHGWKFDVAGRCVDMPTEAPNSNFKTKVSLTAYPVIERGGVLWTYMGPKDFRPEMPEFEYLHVPELQRFVSWNRQECNYAQAIEGGIDTAHSNFLHATLDAYHMTEAWRQHAERTHNLRDIYHARDQHPRLFAEDTDFGVTVAARRDTGDGEYYWRFNLFLLPFYTMPPAGGGPVGESKKFFHAFVPLDDSTCARWTFVWDAERQIGADERAAWRMGSGLHSALLPGPEHRPVLNNTNDYMIDRKTQREYTFTGIPNFADQDYSVQEGMGAIAERQFEHLGTTDVGIIKSRKRLLREALALQEGEEPYSATHGSVYHVRAGHLLLPTDADWTIDQKVRMLMTPTC